MAYTKLLLLDDAPTDIFTATCSAGVTGGNWVVCGSNTLAATLTSGTQTFDTNMVNVAEGSSGTSIPMGLALQTVASGLVLGVLRAGTVILPANATCNAGTFIASTGNGACIGVTTASNDVIGQSYTTAASGGFVVARIKL